jgi:hypothetical protein
MPTITSPVHTVLNVLGVIEIKMHQNVIYYIIFKYYKKIKVTR